MLRSSAQSSSISNIIFGNDEEKTPMTSSYAAFASNAPSPRNPHPYESPSNTSFAQQKYKKTDIFGIHENTDKPVRESMKRTYFNKSTVFDADQSSQGYQRPQPNRMASNIFFSDSRSAPAAEPSADIPDAPQQVSTNSAYVPSQGPRSRGTPRIGSPSSNASQTEKRHTFGTPNNYQASSVFDEQTVAPSRGARRHYHYQTSDIFHASDLPPANSSQRPSLTHSSNQSFYEPEYAPPSRPVDYVKSTSFSNIFGESSYQPEPDMTRNNRSAGRSQQAEEFKDRVEYMTRPGGLTTDQLNRETRGRARLSGPPSNQIWF